MIQLHVSGMNLLTRCGVAFANRYLLHMPEPRSVSLIVGSAVDRSVSRDLTEKKDTGSLLADSDVKDIARDSTVEEWNSGDVQMSEEDKEDGWTAKQGDAVDAAVDLASLHHEKNAPSIEPTHIQRAWVLDTPLGIQLAGTIDIQEGMRSIRDTKTSGKSPNKDTAALSLQLTTYAMAVNALDGGIPAKVGLDYLVRTPKRKELKLVQLESVRRPEDFQHLVNRVQIAAKIIESGIFTPAPIDSWVCSKRFCGYWETCPYAAHPVMVQVNGGKE